MALSQASQSIGFPMQLPAAIKNFSNLSRNLVQSPELAQLLELKPRNIIASRVIPEQDLLSVVRPDPKGFLPPIISLAAARTKAAVAYDLVKPEPLVHSQVQNFLNSKSRSWTRD